MLLSSEGLTQNSSFGVHWAKGMFNEPHVSELPGEMVALGQAELFVRMIIR